MGSLVSKNDNTDDNNNNNNNDNNNNNKNYEIINIPNAATEYQLNIQIVRKICLMNSLKFYFENSRRNSIYFRYIIGTLEYETVQGITAVYKIHSNFFYAIFRIRLFKDDEYMF
jgi:hypothetical protein